MGNRFTVDPTLLSIPVDENFRKKRRVVRPDTLVASTGGKTSYETCELEMRYRVERVGCESREIRLHVYRVIQYADNLKVTIITLVAKCCRVEYFSREAPREPTDGQVKVEINACQTQANRLRG